MKTTIQLQGIFNKTINRVKKLVKYINEATDMFIYSCILAAGSFQK